ncbi:MAG: hypothetical protein LBU58_10990, partial [Clostridiales bacterium]|nr:hypothetical protein [Clostridiales bacterium]
LPAFTQCAYVHASTRLTRQGSARVERLTGALRALQTSSPSFLLTASLDYAREFMQDRGARELDRILDHCERFYEEMARLGYGIPADIWGIRNSEFGIRNGDKEGGGGGEGRGGSDRKTRRYGRDMTRLVLNTARIGLPGTEADRLLSRRYGVKIEMSDPAHIVMIATVADRDQDFCVLKDALTRIANDRKAERPFFRAPETGGAERAADAERAERTECGAAAPADGFSPEAAPLNFAARLHAPKTQVPLEQAEGRTAASLVTPYPPGIPLLCPGERVTGRAVAAIQSMRSFGVRVNGILDGGGNDNCDDGNDDDSGGNDNGSGGDFTRAPAPAPAHAAATAATATVQGQATLAVYCD